MTTDKSKELSTSIQIINGKLHFEGKADGNEPISIDYNNHFFSKDGINYFLPCGTISLSVIFLQYS